MKTIIPHFVLPLVALFGVTSATSVQFPKGDAQRGTLETMIVGSGILAMDVDLNRLNGKSGTVERETLRFQAVNDSYFPVLVYNNNVRGVMLGSIGLIPQNSLRLPGILNESINQLRLERMPFEDRFSLAVRDAKTGFTYFNVEGESHEYDAATRSFQIGNGRLLLSSDYAKSLGRPADTDAVVGGISLAVTMRIIEVTQVVNGAATSATLPSSDDPQLVNGPDVIVGDLPALQQVGAASGTQVGIVLATTSCNNGNTQLNWNAMPNTDHPVIPQNVYRMSGGPSNNERLEQIGQSWLKHAFTALQQNACGFGCASSGTGTRLGVGCSDPYGISENQTQSGLGSRGWVNPFTGGFTSSANSHTGHTHNGTSHRILIEMADLSTASNPGATYFGEGQYVTPHEYAWCQSHPGECNMYNNVSYRQFTVSGTSSFSFSPSGATVRTAPAINAWTGATVNQFEPEPGVDGRGFVGYKVSGPVGGIYHYEYAVYNQNLDRAIQSFSVPLGCGVTLSNVGFRSPVNAPGFANDSTVGNTGYSNAAWTPNQTASAITWSSETMLQNANANAIRWGTMYNFRFDSTRPPQAANATVGFFKTGAPITVGIQVPTPDPCAPLTLSSAVSRKMHGALGPFDINLPLSAPYGIECRTGGANGDHAIVVTFSNGVVSGNAAVTEGTGAVSGTPTFTGNTMTVNLTGVPNVQQVKVTLSQVTDTFSQVYPDTQVVVKSLYGDVDGNSSVSSGDISQVKAASSSSMSGTTFRFDVTADGAFTSSDISIVKSMAGATLP